MIYSDLYSWALIDLNYFNYYGSLCECYHIMSVT